MFVVRLAAQRVDDVEAFHGAADARAQALRARRVRRARRHEHAGGPAALGLGRLEVDALIIGIAPLEQPNLGGALIEQVAEIDIAVHHPPAGGFAPVIADEQGAADLVEFGVGI